MTNRPICKLFIFLLESESRELKNSENCCSNRDKGHSKSKFRITESLTCSMKISNESSTLRKEGFASRKIFYFDLSIRILKVWQLRKMLITSIQLFFFQNSFFSKTTGLISSCEVRTKNSTPVEEGWIKKQIHFDLCAKVSNVQKIQQVLSIFIYLDIQTQTFPWVQNGFFAWKI